ncbi:SDR family NAD(P)-dependent oxidoreductase [Emcibacter nanhaiensis]|uniref:SDR family NAD(P)-dependent oxidoreductase n=1 Tax=Emcibacter nanhaiensis TaxID=1505037 RepID=A0A501PBX2_9PROT|nr:SDR family NAD(P)-dependent oxidoreductase [Emcibacter nanhaiensis]TPD57873.1 SDR family NAD(P)-dependent oxidoreductase [Emcibacter nanhaiensis]
MKDFAGRTAFVTGGANGIGLGLARALLDEGCKVAIADIREDSLEAALKTLDNRNVMGVKLDVASREGYARTADEVEEQMGPVSLLFNNAGINLFQTIDESTYDDWDWVLGVNLHGVINGIQTFVPRMKERGLGGHIVNTASMASFLCGPAPGIYNCSKFAVRGMSESLRYSLAPQGIGVSVLCPGLVKSYIYASDSVRPENLANRGTPENQAFTDQLANVHQYGMEPDEVAAKVLDAIRANRFYIFSHPEFKEELQEVFDEIIAAFPPMGDLDDNAKQRLEFEKGRRESYRKARQEARGE